MSTAPVVQVSS